MAGEAVLFDGGRGNGLLQIISGRLGWQFVTVVAGEIKERHQFCSSCFFEMMNTFISIDVSIGDCMFRYFSIALS